MYDEPQRETGLYRLFEVWRRRKWLAIMVFVTVVTALATAAAALPDLYRSTATVLVERPQVAESVVRPSVTTELEIRLHTITQEVLSRAGLGPVIERLGLYPELRRRASEEAAVKRLRRDINVDVESIALQWDRRATIALTLSYQGRDPDTVADVVNMLAALYVEKHSQMRERETTGTTAFLEAQLADTKRELEQRDQRLSQFRARHGGALPQQLDANLAALARLNADLRLNSEQQARALERRRELARQQADMETVVESGDPEEMTTRLARLKQELHELRTRFTEEYPDVQRLRAEIATLERGLTKPAPDGAAGRKAARSADPGLREALSELNVEIAALREDEKRLRRAIAVYEDRVDNVPKLQQEFEELSRDYEMTKARYQSLLGRLEEAQLAQGIQRGRQGEELRVLNVATPGTTPQAPNRRRLLLLALGVAAGTAVAAMLLAERFDTSFHTVESLQASTSLPVLVSIPLILTAGDRVRRYGRFSLATLGVIVGVILVAGVSYHVAYDNEGLARLVSRGRL